MNILLIEDDIEICLMVKAHLEKYNYEVFYTLSGANGIDMIKKIKPILVVLDLMLPYVNGDRILEEIRTFSDVPVIVVSARGLTQTKIEILQLGADDYITKPFDLDELLARIEVNLKRCQKSTPELNITVGEVIIDTASKTVKVAGEEIVLTAKEYQILELLMKYPDKVFSKKNLYETIWQEPFARDVAIATSILETSLHTTNYIVMPDKSIRLYDYLDQSGKVSTALSDKGVTIYQLVQTGDDLETFYTKLIGGDRI